MLSRPQIKQADVPYYEAFSALNASRQAGAAGNEAIPISDVLAYLQLVGIASVEARVKYLRLIQKMDATFRAYTAENANQRAS